MTTAERRRLGTAALAFAALALGVACLELVSAWILPGLEERAAPGALRAIEPQRTRFEELYFAAKILHPYLGYAANPDDPRVNDYGWFGGDPLAPREPGEVVVAIFGGSLAMSFQVTGEQFSQALAARAFPGARVRIVHAALDGYKQPQQLIQLAFLFGLGARFDAVINLDGFNEVALPFAENVPAGVYPFYPRNWHLFSKQGFSAELAHAVVRVDDLAQRRERWRSRLQGGPLANSRLIRVLGLHLDQRLYRDWQQAITGVEASLGKGHSDFHDLGPRVAYGSESELFADLVRVWRNGSEQMAHLCARNGAAYYHFLQPNQYVPGAKVWSAAEQRTMAGPKFSFRHAVEVGYPLLRAAGAELAAAGVSFTDLTDLFRSERDTIYIDRCCHMNERGYQRMNDEIAAVIARAPRG